MPISLLVTGVRALAKQAVRVRSRRLCLPLHARAVPESLTRPTLLSGMLRETGSDHLHVIAQEVSRVAELCIGQDMDMMSTAMAFMKMEA
jgi:hypothetical protein